MTEKLDHVTGVVLAGGRNSRMGGRDKAFLRVEGRPVIERTLEVLGRCFGRVVVVTNCPEKYAGCAATVTSDELKGLGPLGGLHAGLGAVQTTWAFVTACDMPFLREETIRFLVEQADGDVDAVIPVWEGDIEPLHAVYAGNLRPRIEAAVSQGVGALRELLPSLRTRYIAESTMRRVPGAEESFRNINTPEEAARFAVQL